MRLHEIKNLLESRTLTAVLNVEKDRAKVFLDKIKNKVPFPLDTKKDLPPVVIDPAEYNRVKAALDTETLDNNVPLRTIDPVGGTVKINKLKKTPDLGGKEAETIPVKPTDVFGGEDIEVGTASTIKNLGRAGAFPVSDLNNKIQTSEHLDNLGNIGKAVKEIAAQIDQGKTPVVPSYLKPAEKKAIELYAGEYLGILSVFNRVAKFDKRPAFDEFLGQDLGKLMLYFPKTVSNPLADSFAIQNKRNGHTLTISSKAAGKGAAPSLEGLKIPSHVEENPKYNLEVEFLKETKNPSYTAFTQPFGLMNFLYNKNPKFIREEFHEFLPWTTGWIEALEEGLDTKKQIKFSTDVMKKIISTIPKGRPASGTDAGVIWYAVISEVMNTINKRNALPEFRAVVLETLGYNFMQVYTLQKGNSLVTNVFWPAKIDGKVQLKTKGYAANPKYGRMGFQVSS